MKKFVYTISIVALSTFFAKSQSATEPAGRKSTDSQQTQPANGNSTDAAAPNVQKTQQTVPAGRGEASTAPVNAAQPAGSGNPSSAQTVPAGRGETVGNAPNDGGQPVKSRHAITEKGIPASRNTKDVNSEKPATPPNSGGTQSTGTGK